MIMSETFFSLKKKTTVRKGNVTRTNGLVHSLTARVVALLVSSRCIQIV